MDGTARRVLLAPAATAEAAGPAPFVRLEHVMTDTVPADWAAHIDLKTRQLRLLRLRLLQLQHTCDAIGDGLREIALEREARPRAATPDAMLLLAGQAEGRAPASAAGTPPDEEVPDARPYCPGALARLLLPWLAAGHARTPEHSPAQPREAYHY
jgi:hypothetical protein